MRLIDADELKKHKYHDGKACENAVAVYYIDNAPTVDIVRCKECKNHKVIPFWGNACFYWCEFHNHATNADNYCSYGERKSDEAD